MHFDGDALPEGVNNFVIFEDDSETADTNERMFEGMFHGVPGTFACTGNNECRAENDADGDLAKLLGTWTFTPKEQEMGDDAYMVAGVVPDAGLDLALRQMPVAYDPTAAGRARQMRIRLDKTGNFRLHRLPK